MIVELTKYDDYNIKISTSGNSEIITAIDNYFSPYADGYFFHPKYKQGVWNGRINFFNKRMMTLPIGLFEELMTMLNEKNYLTVLSEELRQIQTPPKTTHNIQLPNWFSKDGEQYSLHDYQADGINCLLDHKFGIAVVGTAGGKMPMIVAGIKGMLEEDPSAKILVICIRQQLVEQVYKEFAVTGESQDKVVRLHGENKEALKSKNPQVVIATWQSIDSLRKKGKDFFKLFDAVIVDEVQSAKANVLSNILDMMKNTTWRFGLTGSMPPNRADKYTVLSKIGPVRYIKKSKSLQDEGYISKVYIKMIGLMWKRPKKDYENEDYPQERNWLEQNSSRNKFIGNLVHARFSRKKEENTLILVEKIEHGKTLQDIISKLGYETYFVHGSMNLADREDIRELAEEKNNICIVATYGTFSTGINIKRIHSIIFAMPGKGEVRTVQSIGRGLRKTDKKDSLILFDIFDDTVFSKKHMKQRQQIYKEQGFPFSVSVIDRSKDLCNC